MAHEGWPGWAKAVFVLGALALVVLGIISILISQHQGGGWLGVACIVVGVLYLFGLLVKPRWIDNPSEG